MTLRRWLDLHDVSITDFAARTGQTRANVYLLLAGSTPNLSTLLRITRATNGLVGIEDFKPGRKKRKKRAPAEAKSEAGVRR